MTGARRLGLGAALLALAACAGGDGAPVLDLAKLPSIAVGESSRVEVFQIMGRPTQVLRGARGESWVYQAQASTADRRNLAAGAQVASTVAGVLIPFVGLVGTGIGLASQMGGDAPPPGVTTVTIDFADPGIVRDCTISTNVMTTNELVGADRRTPLDCRRALPLTSTEAPGSTR